MGNIFHQRSPPESGAESSSNSGVGGVHHFKDHQYFYPPRHGKYFGGNFIMGGDKFEMSQPEAYLFGENYDLNYLGGRPSPFPYSAPLPNEPMHMLRALVNIRKETLKLVAVPGATTVVADEETTNTTSTTTTVTTGESKTANSYAIEFIFDADVDCTITIYLLCREDTSPSLSSSGIATGVRYIPRDPKHRSEAYRYKAGIGQQFSQSSALFNPHQYHASDLSYHILDEKGEYNAAAPYPVVIHVVADDEHFGGEETTTSPSSSKQSHTLIASVEKLYEDVFSLKPLKQKLFVDGLSYLLQEIYGIENKVVNSNKVDSSKGAALMTPAYDDDSENSYECVICMSDLRDTLILPCRHLCLCKSCANSLRYQANNCPICRVPFRALLQIKAVKRQVSTMHLNSTTNAMNNCSKTTGANTATVNNNNTVHSNSATGNNNNNCMSNNNTNSHQQQIILSESLNDLMVDIPPGFEILPLVEALNGVNPQSYLGSLQKLHHQSANLELDSNSLSPERHVFEKGGGAGGPLANGGDLEAAVVAVKRTGKKKSDASLESMTSTTRVAKIDMDVEGVGVGLHPLEDSVSFSKKSAHDEYNIKYFYNSSKAQKTSQTKTQQQQQQQQPKYSSVASVSSPATDDSVSASSSSSGNVEVGGGSVGSTQERTRLLRKSSKANQESVHAPVVVVASTRELEMCNKKDVHEERSHHHHHRHHHHLDTSQSSDSCEAAVLHASLEECNGGGEETPPIELGEISHLKGLDTRSPHDDP